jgi:DHA2 family multidrug resistance protein-like MFS transporter
VNVTDATQAQLQLSYASAENLAQQHPQYADQIIAAAESSFLDGDRWAYLAAILAILIGMALVFRFFPGKDDEERLRTSYQPDRPGGQKASG